jgi:hypothetical protein
MIAAAQDTFVPRFLDGSPHVPTGADRYVRVRMSGIPTSADEVTVYLPDGTALLVPVRDLVQLAPADE